MRMTLVGYRSLDFTSGDGTPIKGTQLFANFPEDGVMGEICEKFFARDGMELPPLSPGVVLDLSFNRKGKIEAVKAVPQR